MRPVFYGRPVFFDAEWAASERMRWYEEERMYIEECDRNRVYLDWLDRAMRNDGDVYWGRHGEDAANQARDAEDGDGMETTDD
jgi:hypothetical protein